MSGLPGTVCGVLSVFAAASHLRVAFRPVGLLSLVVGPAQDFPGAFDFGRGVFGMEPLSASEKRRAQLRSETILTGDSVVLDAARNSPSSVSSLVVANFPYFFSFKNALQILSVFLTYW